jgi:sec-independent protein translocase protein TatB
MPDILFILLLALVIFGPKKLPEIARQIAKYMAQFRQMSNDFKRQLESEMLRIELDEKQAPAKSYQLAATNPPLKAESQPQSPPS